MLGFVAFSVDASSACFFYSSSPSDYHHPGATTASTTRQLTPSWSEPVRLSGRAFTYLPNLAGLEGRLEKHTTSADETVPLKEVEDEPLAPEAHWKKNAVMLG